MFLTASNLIIILFGKRIYVFYSKDAKPKLYRYSFSAVFSLIVTAYSLYFLLGTEIKNPHLVATILFTCYIIAAPILYRLLGKINIQPVEEKTDGEIVVKEKTSNQHWSQHTNFDHIPPSMCEIKTYIFGS